MREIRTYGSEGGAPESAPTPYQKTPPPKMTCA